jgi:hypothetical protein
MFRMIVLLVVASMERRRPRTHDGLMDLMDVPSTGDDQVWRMRKFSFEGRIPERILFLLMNLSIGPPFSSLALPNRISFFCMILPKQHINVLNIDAGRHSSVCLENLSLLAAWLVR